MTKSALIRDLRAELASRNRDLWTLTDLNFELREEVRVLEAIIVEQEAEQLRQEHCKRSLQKEADHV